MKLNPVIFCLPAFVLCTLAGQCQHTEPALLKVSYSFIYLYDKVNNTPASEKEVTLRVGKTNSMFDNLAKSSTPQQMPVKQNAIADLNAGTKTKTLSGTPIISISSKENNDELIYQIPDENSIVKYKRLGFQDYKIETAFPKIEWEIGLETKMIGGYSCQRATGTFGGRIYTAWFAPDLPFRYGPWKLCGLPGLILEAADKNNEVVFRFKSITKPKDPDYIILDAYRPVSIKDEAFDKAKKNYDKDPIAFSQAQLRGDAKISQITFIDASGNALTGDAARAAIKQEQKKIITNPLEIDKQ